MKIAYVGISENPAEEIAGLRAGAAALGIQDSISVWLPGASGAEAVSSLLLPTERGISGGVPVQTRLMEAILEWLLIRRKEENCDLVFFPSGIEAHELAVRLSARLGCSCYTDVHSLRRDGEKITGRKKVCGSNLDWEFAVEPPAVLTLAARYAPFEEKGGGVFENIPVNTQQIPSWLLAQETLESYRVNPLENDRFIFAAGRGMGNAAACERLRKIAVSRGASLGFSRPAALNGWGKITDIIGQSGIKTRAEICIAVGVSGSAAFMAGIDSVEHLVAVNTDKNAPIFHYADMGIIASAEEFMNSMEKIYAL